MFIAKSFIFSVVVTKMIEEVVFLVSVTLCNGLSMAKKKDVMELRFMVVILIVKMHI